MRATLLLSCAILVSATLAEGASAQSVKPEVNAAAAPAGTAAPVDNGLAEIIVTAQRRAEKLQNVPVAATAFTGASVAAFRLTDVSTIQSQTPNLVIKSQFGSTNPNIFIRGVGQNDFNDNATSAVGVYIDDVYLSSPAGQLAELYDIERIEVLRGPQGTLYGKNTTAGAVNVFSQKPKLDSFGGFFRGGYGNMNDVELEGAVNIPLSPTLAFRVAGVHRNRDGWIYNHFDGRLINKIDESAGRAQLLWQPSSSDRILFNVNGSLNRSDKAQGKELGLNANGTNVVGFIDPYSSPREASYNFAGPLDNKQYGGFVRWDHDLEHITLSSISAYNRVTQIIQLDTDQSPVALNQSVRNGKSWQATQELRATTNFAGRFNVVAGAFYFRENIKAKQLFANAPPVGPFPAVNGNLSYYNQDTEGFAFYGQGNFKLTDTLTLTGGIRYTDESKDFFDEAYNVSPYTYNPAGGTILSARIPPSQRHKGYSDTSWKGGIDWKPTTNILLYFSAAKGFRAGGFNGGANTALFELTPFEPETLISYEVGTKTQWFDRKLQFNVTAFHYDYSNLQVFSLVDGSTIGFAPGTILRIITNSANATVNGVELEAKVRPTARLEAGLNAAFLPDAKYENFLYGRGTPAQADRSGNRLLGAPENDFSGYGSVRF